MSVYNHNVIYISVQLYEFEIPEAFSLNTPFGQVQADDADIGTNAELYYHMLGESKFYTISTSDWLVHLANSIASMHLSHDCVVYRTMHSHVHTHTHTHMYANYSGTVNTTCSNEFCVDLETGELTLTKTLVSN